MEYWNGLWTERHGTNGVKLMMQARRGKARQAPPRLQQGSRFLVPRQGTPNFLVTSSSPLGIQQHLKLIPVFHRRPGQTRSFVLVQTLTEFLTTGTSTAAMHTPANLANNKPWKS